MNQKIIKPLTFIVFAGLLTGFVAYRSGWINNPVSFSREGINPGNPDNDLTIFPSTKSALVEDYIPEEADTPKPVKKSDSVSVEDFRIMGSSKSGRIIEREKPLRRHYSDTHGLKMDSISRRRLMIMSSSKSMQVIQQIPVFLDSIEKAQQEK